NLGVIVWHPQDGFGIRFSSSLDRVKAVDPRLRIRPLKEQLESIESELKNSGSVSSGREMLSHLAKTYTEGLEVTVPYPARMSGLHETLERLYSKLVSPVEEIRMASSQRRFAVRFRNVLSESVKQVDPKGAVDNIGRQEMNGVTIDVGYETTIQRRRALWHPLSLQAKDRPDDQIAVAKAASMDILTIRKYLKKFKNTPQLVVLQPPKEKASESLPDVINWLNREADEVVQIAKIESLSEIVVERLKSLRR
ncbi:MAG: DUF3037 domain-containing protein, partial [Planctomycetes bacterium]|nr:DUF3037 domain-containing protein [Planctomycetota bacterium]